MKHYSFEGKHVLITGASGGLVQVVAYFTGQFTGGPFGQASAVGEYEEGWKSARQFRFQSAHRPGRENGYIPDGLGTGRIIVEDYYFIC